MLAVGGSGVTRTVEIARPFQLSFNFFYQGLSHSLHLATTCCLVDGHDDNPPDTENDIDTVTSSHISLAPRFLFHIFEYLLARAKYSYHVARLSLSIVRHSFPTIFRFQVTILSRSLSVLLLLSCQRLRIPNLSFLPRFTDYGRSYYFATFCLSTHI